jgi:hypothetical protein
MYCRWSGCRQVCSDFYDHFDIFAESYCFKYTFQDSLVTTSMDNGAEVSTGATRTCDLKAFGPVAAGVIKEEVGTWVYVCMYVYV